MIYSPGDFLGLDVKWQQKIRGVSPNEDDDLFSVDIEPITGKGTVSYSYRCFRHVIGWLFMPPNLTHVCRAVLCAQQRLMVNLYADPAHPYFNAFNLKFPLEYD